MEFFDKLGKKATEAYKVTADKTEKIAKETKIKFRMGDLKSKINDIYEEIGKEVYEKHVKNEPIEIKDELEEKCIKIDQMSDEIEALLKECLELKDKKQCPECFSKIEKEAKFCPNCGKEQEQEEPAKEVEIVENTSENVENTENTSEDNLEKTVRIESDVEEDN